MQRMMMLAAIGWMGCATTNTPPDGGTDAFPGDAHVCQQGETCDCRASSLLPAGTHWVGVDFAGSRIDPAHRVTLTREAWVGTYEASAGCYRRCVDEGRCTEPAIMPGPAWPGLGENYWRQVESSDLPIMGLSPDQADAYCGWLGGRLPTGAEWEKLARGEDGRELPWRGPPANPRFPMVPILDREICMFANGTDCFRPIPSVIDELPNGRGPYGHFHVIGNAFEYVSDGLAPYGPGDVVDPRVPSSGPDREIRSMLGYGFSRGNYEGLGPIAGVRCAFDSQPEMLAR